MKKQPRLKNKIVVNKNNDTPFEEDQTSPMADQVKDYLNNKEEEPEEDPVSVPEDIKKMLEGGNTKPEDQDGEDEDESRVEVPVDNVYENSDSKDPFANMFVSVKDTDVPITEEDKTAYIKATLFDNPVMLTIKANNGTSAKCRTLTAYESDVCYTALGMYLKKYPEYPTILWSSLMQQLRFPMQVVEYCGKEQKCIDIKYEPGKKEEAAAKLIELSDELLGNIPYPAYNNRIRLLNVFNNKIALLQSATFNEDFWNPDDIG